MADLTEEGDDPSDRAAASPTATYKVMRSGSSITVPRQLEPNPTLKTAAPASKEK